MVNKPYKCITNDSDFVNTRQDSWHLFMRCFTRFPIQFIMGKSRSKKKKKKEKKDRVQLNQKGKIGGGLNGIEETETDVKKAVRSNIL